MTRRGQVLARLALFVAVGLFGPGAARAEGMTIWSLLHRDGPFAAAVAPVADGLRDYLAMINARDGGVNGIPLVYEECSTGLAEEESAGCYDKARASAIVDAAPGRRRSRLTCCPGRAATALPLLAPGGAPAMIADGRYFPWAFMLPATQLDAAQAMLEAISGRAGRD